MQLSPANIALVYLFSQAAAVTHITAYRVPCKDPMNAGDAIEYKRFDRYNGGDMVFTPSSLAASWIIDSDNFNGLQTWADYQLTDKEGDDYVDPPREVNGLRCIDAPNYCKVKTIHYSREG